MGSYYSYYYGTDSVLPVEPASTESLGEDPVLVSEGVIIEDDTEPKYLGVEKHRGKWRARVTW